MRRIVPPIGYARRGLFRSRQSDSARFARAIRNAFIGYLQSNGTIIPPEAKSLLLARIDHKVNQDRAAHKLAYPPETLRRDLEDARLHLASPAQCVRLLAAARIDSVAARLPVSQRRDLRSFLKAVIAECQPSVSASRGRARVCPRSPHPGVATGPDGRPSGSPPPTAQPLRGALTEVTEAELEKAATSLVGELADAIHRATGRPLNVKSLRLTVTTRAAQFGSPLSWGRGRLSAGGQPLESRSALPSAITGWVRLHAAFLTVADRVGSRAFYDPDERSVTLVLENLRPGNHDQLKAVLLHELVHAWQYQHYPQLQRHEQGCREALRRHYEHGSGEPSEVGRDLEDRVNAVQRLLEGHASLIEGTFIASRYPHVEHRVTALERLVLGLKAMTRAGAEEADWYVVGACRLSAVSERPELLSHMLENPTLAEVLLRTRGPVLVEPTKNVEGERLRADVKTLFALNPDRGALQVTVQSA